MGIIGLWGAEQAQVIMVNVYAPCDLRGKRQMWDEILNQMEVIGGNRWCIMGDFNSIKSPGERKGVDGYDRAGEMESFGNFISEASLIDLPLIGRKYTWYKPDGTAMSRLDRFSISEDWLNTWDSLSQWGLKRTVSDHCAVVLKEKEVNWGQKPFCMLRCWEDMAGYEEFVKQTWRNTEVGGWKGYVLKEKLKRLKASLKEWHKSHMGNLDAQISKAKEELNRWDMLVRIKPYLRRNCCQKVVHGTNPDTLG